DFNGDGLNDLAISGGQWRTLFVALQRADHSFSTPTSYPLEQGPGLIDSADLNGDGKPDLVLEFSRLTIRTMVNRGDGTFDPPTPELVAATDPPNLGRRRFALFDVNRDQKVDLVVLGNSGRLHVHFGVGDGTFQAAVGMDLPGPGFEMLARDVNEDGLKDVVLLGVFGGAGISTGITVLLERPEGGFTPPVTTKIPAPRNDLQRLVAGDVDGDGHVDLAVAPRFDGEITLLHGDGSGNFEVAGSRPSDLDLGSIEIGDFNEDGTDELVLANA